MKKFLFFLLFTYGAFAQARTYLVCYTKSDIWLMRYQPVKPFVGCLKEEFSSLSRAQSKANQIHGTTQMQTAIDELFKECVKSLCTHGTKTTWYDLYCNPDQETIDFTRKATNNRFSQNQITTANKAFCDPLKNGNPPNACQVSPVIAQMVHWNCSMPDPTAAPEVYEVR